MVGCYKADLICTIKQIRDELVEHPTINTSSQQSSVAWSVVSNVMLCRLSPVMLRHLPAGDCQPAALLTRHAVGRLEIEV